MTKAMALVWITLAHVTLSGPADGAEFGDKWRSWSHASTIELADVNLDSTLVAIPVSADLYDHAQPDLSDLRVLDRAGEEVGYVVFAKKSQGRRAWRGSKLSDTGFVVGEYIQAVADVGESDELHNLLEVKLGSGEQEFFSWVELGASRDRETWRVVRERAPIYRFSNSRPGLPQTALWIRYPPTRDRWLRLRLLTTDQEVSVEGIRVCEQIEETPELLPVASGISLSSESPADESHWTTTGLPGLPITAVEFSTSREAFHRPVEVSVSDDGKAWRQVARGLIYRFPAEESADEVFPASARESTRIEFADTTASHWRVAVLDRNDRPIADLGVTLERTATFVVFRPERGASYRLVYGNRRAARPSYEIAQLTTREDLAAAAQVGLGPAVENSAYLSPEPFTERHPVILWMALGLVVLVLGGLALKSLK